MMQTIPLLPQPVIAKVQGVAAAAGCQLVAQCDLAVAADGAKFVTSGVTWGFFCSTPGVAVGRNLQRKHAMEMLLTGEPISAQRALEWGLVNRVVPADQLDSEVEKLAATIAAKPPATVAAGKRAFYQQMRPGPRAGLRTRFRRDLGQLRARRGPRRHGRLHREAPAAEALTPAIRPSVIAESNPFPDR